MKMPNMSAPTHPPIQRFKYRFSRRTLCISVIYLLVYALLALGLYRLYEGGYFSAWFTTIVAALFALMSLSIPREIRIDDQKVSIRCLLDLTEIPVAEIVSVRRVEPHEMRRIVPVFGACGFFGYYGHFIDLKLLEHVRIYATEWRDFVEITDVYDDVCYVAGIDAEALVAAIEQRLSV